MVKRLFVPLLILAIMLAVAGPAMASVGGNPGPPPMLTGSFVDTRGWQVVIEAKGTPTAEPGLSTTRVSTSTATTW